MTEQQIAAVRRFNRLVTERVGALNDHYLARDRSLGAARVLWEIGDDGRDVRSLRTELGLDSGYLSRLLRSLEDDGLVTVGARADDRRVREARLTRLGTSERSLLDRRSDGLAASLMEHLSGSQRDRLVDAMGVVERLLTAAMVEVGPIDPEHPSAQHCLGSYFAELDRRFDAGFDVGRSIPADADQLRMPAGVLLVATRRSAPLGCGALRFGPGGVADIKRMWVGESARGLGLGKRILAELESFAAAHGARTVRLETNRALVEAISLYRSSGYREVTAFNDEPYADHWFEKRLSSGR